MHVNVVCRNLFDDRVIPRFARYLRDVNGWSLTSGPDLSADVVYLSGYFESQMCKRGWPRVCAAYFTHREEDPPGNDKAKLFDAVAQQVQLRIATARMYADYLEQFGPAVQIRPPVERERFTLTPGPSPRGRGEIVAGFSGYSYRSGRKGEDLAGQLVQASAGAGDSRIARTEWRASGRDWPVKTKRYDWQQMPGFFQGLDILVVTSLVEGVPMPPLEALSCGVSVVVPRGVGLLDELGRTPSGEDVLGIHRYRRGDAKDLVKAFGKAVKTRPEVDREALRAVTEGYTVENWCAEHKQLIEALADSVVGPDAGLEEETEAAAEPIKAVRLAEPEKRGTESKRGIYCVAFGDPARTCALRMMKSAKQWMPEIPICLCSDRKVGPEDVLVKQPDSDIGGRRAKLKAYELSPAEWEAVLYLDVDTEVVGDIRFYFQLIEDGWEFVICKDPHLMDTMHAFRRKNNLEELEETANKIFTLHTLQYNGGVWAFGRNERIARFFGRWQAEWERHAQRDQGALIRAMYTEPLRVYVLGNEWNTFPKYTRGIKTAGLMHYPGDARRWRGMIPGRIDSEEAWKAVRQFERRRG